MREWAPILHELGREVFPLTLKDRASLTTHFYHEMDEIQLIFWQKIYPKFNESNGDIIPQQFVFGTDQLEVYKDIEDRSLILSGSTNRIYATGAKSREGNTGVTLNRSLHSNSYHQERFGVDTPYQLTVHTYTDRDTLPLALEERTKGFHETKYYLGRDGTYAKGITVPSSTNDQRPMIYETSGLRHVRAELTNRDFGLISIALDYLKTTLEEHGIT